jgi:hypothetical protein
VLQHIIQTIDVRPSLTSLPLLEQARREQVTQHRRADWTGDQGEIATYETLKAFVDIIGGEWGFVINVEKRISL